MDVSQRYAADMGLEGVKPARQERSLQRRNQLLAAGKELLCEKGLEEVSITEIAAKCGYSIGTFYSRFDDKGSFFRALQRQMVEEAIAEIREEFGRKKWKKARAEEIFAATVDFLIRVFTGKNRGVIKESIVESRRASGAWTPIRDTGQNIADVVVNLLKGRFLKNDPAASEQSVRFGMQMVYGTLVQSLLNDPGPMKLDDPDLGPQLIRMLGGFALLEES